MKERVIKLINKANDNLEAAQLLLAENLLSSAVNRAYYAMFDAFRTLLFIEGVFVKTHKGLQNKLHEIYFSDNKLPRSLSEILSKTEDLREKADYDFDAIIAPSDAQKAVNDAAFVIEEIKKYLQDHQLLND